MATSVPINNLTISNLLRYDTVPASATLFYTVVKNGSTYNSYKITLQNIALGIKYNCLSACFAYIDPTYSTISTHSANWTYTQNFSSCSQKWQDAVTTFQKYSGTWPSINDVYPLNSIYITTSLTHPGDTWPGTTWSRVSQNKTLIGQGMGNDSSISKNFVAGSSHGLSSVALTLNQIPSHQHRATVGGWSSLNPRYGVSNDEGPHGVCNSDKTNAKLKDLTTTDVGKNKAHNNIQPYVVVNMWQRIS